MPPNRDNKSTTIFHTIDYVQPLTLRVMLQLHCATISRPSCTPPFSPPTHIYTHTLTHSATRTLPPTQIETVWGLFFFPLPLKKWKLLILWSPRIANSFSNAKKCLHHYYCFSSLHCWWQMIHVKLSHVSKATN